MVHLLRPLLVALVVPVFLASTVTMLHATLFVTTVETLVLADHAGEIVVGTVLSTRGEWRNRRIVTVARVRVEQRVRGVPGPTVIIVVPGGKVGDVRAEVIGAPRLAVGTRALFLGRRMQQELHLVGLSHGALPVFVDAGGVASLRWIPPGARAYVQAPLATVTAALAARQPERAR